MEKESSNSSPQNEHIESVPVANGKAVDDPFYIDHRADDDRADEAKGRNSDKIDKKYWFSVNYIGTMFAVGMAFMGGIGGVMICPRPSHRYADERLQDTV